MKLPKIKITIVKKTLNKDLIDEFLVEEYKGMKACDKFEIGQEFVINHNLASVPEGFCEWAWADIRDDINLIASGGNILAMKEKGVAITGCSDWFRPVYFKVERLDEFI
ncbi:MAG: TIGR04076 family protein [Candidatus Lokiarchaeota archaeon]|nr:TIGR04076 family protein [Candidatus Lokiarchaeota archaeon]